MPDALVDLFWRWHDWVWGLPAELSALILTVALISAFHTIRAVCEIAVDVRRQAYVRRLRRSNDD